LTDFIRFLHILDMSRFSNIFGSSFESSPNYSLRFPGVQPIYYSDI